MEDRVLRRYQRAFKLKPVSTKKGAATSTPNRDDLVAAVTKHWASTEVGEKETLSYFIYNLRNLDKVYKLPPKPQPLS
ncbi:hypothetical protein HDV00_002050 [Rhizophlyctis rosea]|nr:hypothetical protein HDV00_002050 [Rhizophlyctis rosea]